MTTEELLAQVEAMLSSTDAQIRAQMDAIRLQVFPPPPPPLTEISVNPGDNLQSIVADAPEGILLRIDPAVVATHLVVPRPLTLVGGTLMGGTEVTAPNVIFRGTQMRGTAQGQTILIANDGTQVVDCNLVGSEFGQHRGILANARDVQILNTRITNIWASQDTQCILGYNRTANLLVDGCHLEASGENIMFGGADSTSPENIPTNITVRNSYMWKPLTWRTQSATGCKNLFEIKAGRNILVENCVMENSFLDAQTGFAIVVTVRNQEGRAPWSNVENVLFSSNTVRHVAGGISLLGTDDLQPSGIQNNITFEDNLFEDINSAAYGPNGRTILINRGGDRYTFRRNRFQGPSVNHAIIFSGGPSYRATNLIVENNEFMEGWYGIFGDGAPGLGTACLDYYAPGYVFTGNTIFKTQTERTVRYPAGNTVVMA